MRANITEIMGKKDYEPSEADREKTRLRAAIFFDLDAADEMPSFMDGWSIFVPRYNGTDIDLRLDLGYVKRRPVQSSTPPSFRGKGADAKEMMVKYLLDRFSMFNAYWSEDKRICFSECGDGNWFTIKVVKPKS